MKAKWDYLRSQSGFRGAPVTTVLRLLIWRTRCLLQIGAEIELSPGGPRLFLPPQWRGVAKLIFAFRGHYEKELQYLSGVLSSGEVVVDVGASFGVYTVTAARLVGEAGRVLAFEPCAGPFAVLEKNRCLNELQNVRNFSLALSNQTGKARLYHYPDPSRNSLGGSADLGTPFEEAPTATLDGVLEQEGIHRVDVVKMDVEGAEELVLRGAKSLLERAKPLIVFEVNPEAALTLGLSAYGAWHILRGFGYRFFTVCHGGRLRHLDGPPTGGNVLAIPEGRCVQ